MSSSNSRCAACKFLRRKCSQDCVFAPCFPPDQAQKFANVHKVFGASNVAKLLNGLSPVQREDAVDSLAYEAELGSETRFMAVCVGLISILQDQLKQVQVDLINAKKELANYRTSAVLSYNMLPMLGLCMNQDHGAMPLVMRDHQQKQHLMEAQQLAVAEWEQQEMIRSCKQQQQFNDVFDTSGQVTASGFDQAIAGGLTMSLASESYEDPCHHQIQEQQPEEAYIMSKNSSKMGRTVR